MNSISYGDFNTISSFPQHYSFPQQKTSFWSSVTDSTTGQTHVPTLHLLTSTDHHFPVPMEGIYDEDWEYLPLDYKEKGIMPRLQIPNPKGQQNIFQYFQNNGLAS